MCLCLSSNVLIAPAIAAVNKYNNILNLNETYLAFLNEKADSCGYTSFMEDNLVFPPNGPIPPAPSYDNGCDVFDDFTVAAAYVNPCYNVYHITDFCPFLWDELGSHYPSECMHAVNMSRISFFGRRTEQLF